MNHETIEGSHAPIKAWTRGVPFEDKAREQVLQAASLPFIHHHIAIMPDVHFGIGATVGSVIPTRGAIVPASVGVDIGCGMMAVRTSLTSHDIGDNAQPIFEALSKAIPHGRTNNGGPGDRGAWHDVPEAVANSWRALRCTFDGAVEGVEPGRAANQLGTLGGGNHFVEVCLDEADRVWIMLHSGSRGIGNKIGSHYIAVAKKEAERQGLTLPNRDLAYLEEGSERFAKYVAAIGWAQDYARINREIMMRNAIVAMRKTLKPFSYGDVAVNCHHNYVEREWHFGEMVYVTRKGAVSARAHELGIIPGSMGTRSYIVRGKGNPESFHSCSHGAGRVMPRGEAKRRISLEDHAKATEGVACRKDADVIDESPAAYKPIDAVMEAQSDLVEIVHTLKQIVCVKG